MKKVSVRFLIATVAMVIGVSFSSVSVKAADTRSADIGHMTNLESMVNNYRVENGLSPLSVRTTFKAGADVRAQELSQSFSHTRPDGSAWYTANSSAFYGENLACSEGYISDELTLLAWKLSKEHNANLLEKQFNTMYISYYYSDANDTYYIACEFGI